ncbi:MAG TPA: hypothetical protein PKC45_05215, partial [Gemmatales bacterium]|nr:hypothetical protein [Gemmatales bacterium]
MNGFLNLNKPEGVSSRTVVDRVVEWFPGVKAGHGGTLDPLAEGVLVVALGQGARLIPFIQEQPKVYESTWELGATSPTDDRDGTITRQPVAQPPSAELVRALLARFVGVVEQVPPTFSAARVSGQRAYKLARRGTP